VKDARKEYEQALNAYRGDLNSCAHRFNEILVRTLDKARDDYARACAAFATSYMECSACAASQQGWAAVTAALGYPSFSALTAMTPSTLLPTVSYCVQFVEMARAGAEDYSRRVNDALQRHLETYHACSAAVQAQLDQQEAELLAISRRFDYVMALKNKYEVLAQRFRK